MKIRLYLDEDAMDGDLIDALRARGVDLETAYEAGMVKHQDHDHIARKTAEEMRDQLEYLSNWPDTTDG